MLRMATIESIRRAAAIVTPSEFTRSQLVSRYSVAPEKIHKMSLGVTISGSSAVRTLRERTHLLMVGQHHPRKNFAEAIDGYVTSKMGREGIPLVLVTSKWGASRAVTSQSTALENLHVRHGVDQRELGELYSRAYALLLPSYSEGFGLPALEAMAYGTPVIASKAGALPEVIGEAGILLDRSGARQIPPQVWAHAIRQSIEPSRWETLSLAALRRAAAFTWDVSAHALSGVYRELV